MLTPWVSRIMFLNVAIFVVGTFIPAFGDMSYGLGVLVPALIPIRPWSLVTYMFLHAGWMHLIFNMISLYVFGPRLEAELSGKSFLGLYFVSGIFGGLLSWIFTPGAQIVGASGAIFGLMYGYVRYWPRDTIGLLFIPMEARAFVVLMTALNLFGGVGNGVARFCHLGGFAGAFLFFRIIAFRPRKRRFEAQVRGPRVSRSDLDRWSKIQRETLHEVNREELDRIMEKIEKEGIGSVTPRERTFLDTFSERAGS